MEERERERERERKREIERENHSVAIENLAESLTFLITYFDLLLKRINPSTLVRIGLSCNSVRASNFLLLCFRLFFFLISFVTLYRIFFCCLHVVFCTDHCFSCHRICVICHTHTHTHTHTRRDRETERETKRQGVTETETPEGGVKINGKRNVKRKIL